MNIIVNPEQIERAIELLDTLKDLGVGAIAILGVQALFLLAIMLLLGVRK